MEFKVNAFDKIGVVIIPFSLLISEILGAQLLYNLSRQQSSVDDDKIRNQNQNNCASESPMLYYGAVTSTAIFCATGLAIGTFAFKTYYSGYY